MSIFDMNLRTPIFHHDTAADGGPIVRLQLKSGRCAIIDRDTFDWLVASGYSLRWCELSVRAGRYVVVPAHAATGNLIIAARLIAAAGPGQVVRYRDRDKLNLRRSNLIVERGYAKRQDVSFVPSAGRLAPEPLAVASAAGGGLTGETRK